MHTFVLHTRWICTVSFRVYAEGTQIHSGYSENTETRIHEKIYLILQKRTDPFCVFRQRFITLVPRYVQIYSTYLAKPLNQSDYSEWNYFLQQLLKAHYFPHVGVVWTIGPQTNQEQNFCLSSLTKTKNYFHTYMHKICRMSFKF